MRNLFIIILFLAASVGVTLFAQYELGYVTLTLREYTIEMGMGIFGLLLLASFFVFHFVLRFVFGTLQVPGRWSFWRHNRRQTQARENTNRGMIALAEGEWATAEKLLTRSAAGSDTPLINYLGAARAAQKLNALDRRDAYLGQASRSMPDATLAVGLTQAELQLLSGQSEQALATLRHLSAKAPKHGYVLYMLKKVYERLESWEDLKEIVPELLRRKILDKEKGELLLQQLHSRRLRGCGDDVALLSRRWNEIPKALRSRTELLQLYIERLIALGGHELAERELQPIVRQQWDPVLIRLYGLVSGSDATRQLVTAEKWLKQYGQHPELLLALARICFHNQLWGKGRSYLEASIAFEPRAESYCALGQLMAQLGEEASAADSFRKGLMLATDGNCPSLTIPADTDGLHHH